MNDTLGAFVRANPVALPGAATGWLAGKTFAAKDVFDVAGSITGFGQPDWLRTHWLIPQFSQPSRRYLPMSQNSARCATAGA